MADYAHKKTDDMIAKLEKKIKSDYRKANKECKAKAKEHFAKFAKKDNEMSAKVKAGEITQQEYKAWRVGQMATGKRWNDLCDQLAKDYTNADKIARSTVQGHMAEAYALNRNYGMYQVEKAAKINTSFTLYDRRTVERLWRDNPKLMPSPPKLKTSKAISWNNRHIRSALTQGILQGESIPKIADRMDRVAGAGYSAAVRAARTSMTGAQNAGRVESYEEAADMGIEMEQMWIATLDERTRESHALMDGETVPVGEEFSNGCKFPADPDCDDPAEVYNCRCTLGTQIAGFEKDVTDLDLRNDSKVSGMTYEEWRNSRTSEKARIDYDMRIAMRKLASIDVVTYSGIWRQDVKTSEYAKYKDRIQGKRDYYKQQLQVLDPSDAKYSQFQKYLKDLDEFEKNGSKYMRYEQQLNEARQRMADYKVANSDPSDMFSAARKDAAKWFDNSLGKGFSAADDYFDPPAQQLHAAATSQERDGFYTYTGGSGGHNRPLAGYEKPWFESGSGWEPEYFKGSGNVWIDYEGKGDQIRGLTTLIEKSKYPDDVWLQSGQDFRTLEGSLGIARDTLHTMSDDELEQLLVGKEFRLNQFISTAINKGGGGCFNSKPTKWNIYAPKGSEMLYASDAGVFGKSEAEMILQRGGSYKITRVYWGTDATNGGRRKLFIDMELHPEKGYNKFQQNPKEWKGSKKNYRS